MQSDWDLLISVIILKEINSVSMVFGCSCVYNLLHWDKGQQIYMANML